MEVARDMLIKTVNEFNNIMGLTPKIPDTLDDVLLTKAIEKASTLIDPKDDFSDDVMQMLLQLPILSDDISTVFEMRLAFDANPRKLTRNLVKTSQEDVDDNEKRGAVKKERKPHINRIEELIAEGRHVAANIVNIVVSEFPKIRKETIANYIRTAKSSKYTAYKHVAIEDVNGVLRFDEKLK